MTTQRPVIVQYMEDAPPSDLHPDGVPRGVITETPTPALAREFHPDAVIVQYADGAPYQHRKALAEERELRGEEPEPEEPPKVEPEEPSKTIVGRVTISAEPTNDDVTKKKS